MAGLRVLVVGGGLAGMAAAVALQDAHCQITLLESRKSLGGRAGSFEDPASGQTLDNCQHVLLRCCTNLLDFYRRTAATDRIHWEDAIAFVDPKGRSHLLWAMTGLPAPLHLAISGANFSALSWPQRLALARAMLAMLLLDRPSRDRLAEVSFGQWLAEHDQPADLIDSFYNLVLVSALNENCRDVSAASAIQVFQESLLEHSAAWRMGTPACPLSQLYRDLPCPDVRLGKRISELIFDKRRVVGAMLGSERLDADAVVLAVNYPALEKLVPAELAAGDPRFARLDQLEGVPILGAHLWFDRPVLRRAHAALMGGPLQWIFAKSGEGGRGVHGVISAARDWVDRPREQSLQLFERQIRQSLPEARDAKLERGLIVIEKRATFSPRPGVDRLRPRQAPPPEGLAGLYLAGDYTQTGWPATMEGAVRSGYLAAEAVLDRPGRFVAPDLAPQWPARLLRSNPTTKS